MNGGPSLLWLSVPAAVILTATLMHFLTPAPMVKSAASATRSIRAAESSASSVAFASWEPVEIPWARSFAALVRTINGENDPNRRETEIGNWLATVKPDEIAGLMAFLRSARPPELARDLTRQLIRRWTAQSPAMASAWLATLPADQQSPLLNDVAIAWANRQLTNAMQWAGSLPDYPTRCQVLTTIAGEAVRSQPITALRIAIGLPADAQRDDLINRGAKEWAATDARAAAAWAGQLPPGDLREQTLSSVAIVWSGSEPMDAANFALNQLPPGRLLDDTVISIIERWTQQDPEAAAAWVARFPNGMLRATAIENLFAQWSQTDPDGAQRWQSAHSQTENPGVISK